VASEDISIIGPNDGTRITGAVEGAGIGAAVGGLFARLGEIAIPGIGPSWAQAG